MGHAWPQNVMSEELGTVILFLSGYLGGFDDAVDRHAEIIKLMRYLAGKADCDFLGKALEELENKIRYEKSAMPVTLAMGCSIPEWHSKLKVMSQDARKLAAILALVAACDAKEDL